MKKSILTSLCTISLLWLTNCGNSTQEPGNNVTKDSIQEVVSKVESRREHVPAGNLVKNKVFAFGRNLKDCDAQTYSQSWAMMKFDQHNTVETMTASAINAGKPGFYELRVVSKGTYKVETGVITIEFTKVIKEKIDQGKTVESETKDVKTTWSLKMTKCADGRLQLKSNMPSKNAMGNKVGKNDKSSWSLRM